MRMAFMIFRLAGAALIIAAVVGQLLLSLRVWAEAGIQDPTVQLVSFFSFFTIDSNVLGAAAFLIGAVCAIRGRTEDCRWYAVLRVCATAYMVTTGVVYNVLLRGIELPQGSTLPWANEVLHVVGPLLVLVDWLFAPGRLRLEWRALWAVVAFPIVWGVYTMVRGPLVHDAMTGNDYWYPYPFLNPNIAPEGYLSVAFYIVVIAIVIGSAGAGAIWVSRRFPQRRAEEPARVTADSGT
ncbi:MAG: Pr6Pr family membrane protein [Schumannella sp.]